jgi:hypothetical protein
VATPGAHDDVPGDLHHQRAHRQLRAGLRVRKVLAIVTHRRTAEDVLANLGLLPPPLADSALPRFVPQLR